MTLPKIATVQFKTQLESVEGDVLFRPFLVKEEKMLLMALEGGSEEEIANALNSILNSCILSDVDVAKLPPFDVDKLFIEIRKKSVSEMIEIFLKHVDESKCNHRQKIQVNLDEVRLHKSPEHTKKIMLTDTIGVMMKYPSRELITKHYKRDIKSALEMIMRCIDYVFDEEKVYSDFTDKELSEWIDNLSDSQLSKMADFFVTMPELRHTVHYKCDQCGEEETIEVRGMRDFFTLASATSL